MQCYSQEVINNMVEEKICYSQTVTDMQFHILNCDSCCLKYKVAAEDKNTFEHYAGVKCGILDEKERMKQLLQEFDLFEAVVNVEVVRGKVKKHYKIL